MPKLVQAVVALCALLCSCDGADARKRPNVLMIVVDTLRRDHLGCYGAQRNTSPTVDALAAEGVRFDAAYSSAPWTSPSVASILTGLHPSAHGVVKPRVGLSDDNVTLAEMMKAAGYETGGTVSNPHLRKGHGFGQGFDVYHQNHARGHKYVSTPGITEQVVEMIEQFAGTDEPFFVFALYFDPHFYYQRHPEYGFSAPSAGRLQGGESIVDLRRLATTMTEDERQFVVDSYDEEIRFTDDGIGTVLEALRRTGQLDDTIVVFTADHGEEFLERGWIGHTRTLYDELVRVPLIIAGPGVPRGRSIEAPVSLTALAATVLEFAGAVPPEPVALTPSLATATRTGSDLPGSAFCEVDYVPIGSSSKRKEAHKRAIVRGGWKLIHDLASDEFELYHLDVDPGEQNDLFDRETELAAELRGALVTAEAAAREGAVTARELQLSEEDIENLRGLGYAGSEKSK